MAFRRTMSVFPTLHLRSIGWEEERRWYEPGTNRVRRRYGIELADVWQCVGLERNMEPIRSAFCKGNRNSGVFCVNICLCRWAEDGEGNMFINSVLVKPFFEKQLF